MDILAISKLQGKICEKCEKNPCGVFLDLIHRLNVYLKPGLLAHMKRTL